MSVIDYKCVNSVDVEKGSSEQAKFADTGVSNLKLLVKDERFEDETIWVNAILAGQLWPQPVLDFYLDHLVMEGGDDDSDEDQENSEDWLELIVEGLNLLDRGYKVKEVLGTLNVDVDEWRTKMKQLEEEPEEENDVLEIAASLELVSLRSSRKLECEDNISTADTEIESTSDISEEERGVLLFRVRLALETDDDGKIVLESDDNDKIVLLHLEDLRDLAPEIMTKFLESKLRFIDEDEEDSPERRS